jgi:hypothetical protein
MPIEKANRKKFDAANETAPHPYGATKPFSGLP